MTDMTGDSLAWAYLCERPWTVQDGLCSRTVRWRTDDGHYYCDEHKP